MSSKYHRFLGLIITFVLIMSMFVPQPALAAGGDFVWAKGMGSTGDLNSADVATSIVLDLNGNVYTTGYFQGTADFDPGVGTFNLTSAGGAEIFISKLDTNGNFVWAKGIGGTTNDYGWGIAIDLSGNIYTTGKFQGTADFDPGVGTFNLTSAGGDDIFISKLDTNGNFVWAKNLGGTTYDWGSGTDWGLGITLDPSGNVYTTGYFADTADFDPGVGTFNLTSGGGKDIFISKLDTNGNFVWAKSIGGTTEDWGRSIILDPSGNVYTTGYFADTADFDPGVGTFNLSSAGGRDIFISKLDTNGNFVWAKRMGGTGEYRDFGGDIAIGSTGDVYTTGSFEGTVDFDPGVGTFNLTSAGPAGSSNIFVSRLDSSGNFVWAKRMGGSIEDSGNAITIDVSGNVYTTGGFADTADFDPGAGTFNLTSANDGVWDIFVSKLDTNGNFVWAKGMGGMGNESGQGIAIDPNGNVYTTGGFQGTVDFDPGADTFNLTSAGGYDIFISKLKPLEATFGDVPLNHWAWSYVERLYAAGVTSGCATSPMMYCPTTTVTRDQMAVFLLRGEHGSSYVPPTATGVFQDVPTNYWAGSWIEQLSMEGITAGCGSGTYCPTNPVTRDQMAVFLLKAKHGSGYVPPAPTGMFSDVPTNYWAAAWIEQLAMEEVTAGCGGGKYCPSTPVTRDQMAVFLVKNFNIP